MPRKIIEEMTMSKPRLTVLMGVVLAAAMSRLIPHPPNFTPVAALALFGGANFVDKRTAFLLPVGTLFLSDLFLGFSTLTPVVYGCFALVVCLGLWLHRKRSAQRVAAAALMGSLVFFSVTNLGVWA